jgi:DNA-binding CsgD family transcriptional regulator
MRVRAAVCRRWAQLEPAWRLSPTAAGFVVGLVGAHTVRIMNWDFGGRASELAALEAGWLAAGDGDAPIMVVHGEAGIGKTRTVAELARSVRARDADVFWGTCYEGGGARPYGVWVEATRGYLEGLGPAGLQSTLGGDARWLAPLMTDAPLPDVASANVPSAVARVRLAEVLARMLDSLPRPPVVVLDDMQWATPESLELFGHVARIATGSLIVVIFRGAALELGHPLAQHLAEVGRQRSCEFVLVGSLPRPDAGRLLEQAAGRSLGAPLVDALYEQSDGNPFFLGELGRYLHSHGDVTTVRGGDRPLPESIRGAVGLRAAGLSAETRRMLQLASVFTAGFGFAELQALTDLEELSLLNCLEQALAEELLRSLDGERYDFAHALVRQTLYEGLSPSRRTRLHRRLADALERLHANDSGQVAGELVRQYHASATLAGAQRGAIYALTAADQARAAYAPADAVMMLRLGLDLVTAGDNETQLRLVSALALAEAEAGLVADAPRTLEAAVSLLEQRSAGAEAIAELVYAVGEALWVDAAAIDPLIERALSALGERRDLGWARLKLVRRLMVRDTFGPVLALEWVPFDPQAVQIAREEGDETDYAHTLNVRFPWFGADLEQIIARVDGWRDPVARMYALVDIVSYMTLFGAGRSPGTADRLCSELGALTDDVGLAPHRAAARMFRSTLLGGRGEFAAAASEIREAQALLSGQPPASPSQALVTMVGELASQHVEADWPRVADLMWDLATSPDQHFSGWLSLGSAAFAAHGYARAGEGDRAREILGDILPALTRDDPLESTFSSAIGLAAGAVWELRATDLAQRLLPNARTVANADPREFYMTSSELTVARLSAVTGRFDQAVDYFQRARVTLERRGLWVLRAIVDHDEGLMRLEQHRPDAVSLLAAASARFEELGMREWSRRLAMLEAAALELPDQLTPREAEVLRLVAARRTNKEIAGELVVSVHTVERHVQNVYRKIGARTRGDAAGYVERVMS